MTHAEPVTPDGFPGPAGGQLKDHFDMLLGGCDLGMDSPAQPGVN